MLKQLKYFRRRFAKSFRKPHVRISLLLTACVCVTSTVLLSISIMGRTYRYNIGDIAREDIRVIHDIRYQVEVETQRKKEKAAEQTPLVFDKDQSILVDRLESMDVLFRHVSDVMEENPPIGTEDRTFQLIALKSKLPRYLAYNDRVLLGILKDGNPQRLKGVISKILVYIFDRGILKEPYANPLNIKNTNVVVRTINSTGETSEVFSRLEELTTLEDIRKEIYKKTYAIAPFLPSEQLGAVRDIVNIGLTPNLSFNAEETQRRIDEAKTSVKPVMATLGRGQSVIQAGETITGDVHEKIQIINRNTQSRNVNFILGIFLLQLFFVMIFSYLMLVYYERVFTENKSPFIDFTLIMSFIVYAFVLSRVENITGSNVVFGLLLPVAFVAMMISVLNNVYTAIVAGVYVGFFGYMISGESTSTLVISFSSVLLGAFLARDIEKRTAFLRTGFVIGVINALIAVSICLIQGLGAADTLGNAGLALANGIINAILVLGVLPVYESVFGITTMFRLLELSDLNAPIFKKMIIKAPGTYNHSLMVANMAEAACKEINANHMLARVGGYYHDIGKIPDSGMYIENKITDKRAQTLNPHEYSKLIIGHVGNGVRMAERDNLPDSVIDFIREHHGQTTMTYFYHQALELADSESAGKIDKSEFQYPGPKPSTPEVAVVMLADAIEAASRSIQEPTTLKLEGLVKKIIYNKLNEGELENASLTMFDLKRVQRAFMRILNGIYHTRIEYPTKEEVEDLEDRVMGKDEEDDDD